MSVIAEKDLICLESVQWPPTGMTEGQIARSYVPRMNDLNLYSMERRRFMGDMIETFKIMRGLTGQNLPKCSENLLRIEGEVMAQSCARHNLS